ncbi:hypothetical protein [Alcaligenes sp. WGS1538]|uniref:hypothetical protein n=1 Tax=Alcaligenes sp. WGS1538 TaxID=3366811 RepID=UPI00372D3D5B
MVHMRRRSGRIKRRNPEIRGPCSGLLKRENGTKDQEHAVRDSKSLEPALTESDTTIPTPVSQTFLVIHKNLQQILDVSSEAVRRWLTAGKLSQPDVKLSLRTSG